MRLKSLFISGILVVSISLPVFAKPDISLVLDKNKLANINGKQVLKDADKVMPGEVMVYTIKATNKGDSAAVQFETVGDIPSNTIYMPENNVSADYKILFSIDGGKSYQEKPTINVKQKGKNIVKDAPVSTYNKIKFSFLKALDAKKTVNLVYKVKVK